MSSPQEQNTTIGDLMFRRSTRMPSSVCSSPEDSLLPTKSSSAIACISCGGEQHRAAPPFLEFEIAGSLGIDLGIEVVRLLPIGVGRMQRLEIRDQMRAVENAVAEIARQ